MQRVKIMDTQESSHDKALQHCRELTSIEPFALTDANQNCSGATVYTEPDTLPHSYDLTIKR